jgi:VanZ family protein
LSSLEYAKDICDLGAISTGELHILTPVLSYPRQDSSAVTESAETFAKIMMRFLPLGLAALLITYGSLYPFNFSPAPPGAAERMFSDWHIVSSRGDVVGNIILFIPWGVAGLFSMAPRASAASAVALTGALGFAVSLGVQLAQIWVPSRFPALSDVFWNMVGLAAGLLIGRLLVKHVRFSDRPSVDALMAAALIVAWTLLEWSPLIPSIDLQLLKDQLKSLVASPTFAIHSIFLGTAVALLLGRLLGVVFGYRRSLWMLPALLLGIVIGKFFFRGAPLDTSILVAFIVGAVGWWVIQRRSEDAQHFLIILFLSIAYTVDALYPFNLRDEPAAISWLPFEGMLRGSMMVNLWAVVGSVVLYTSILEVFRLAGGKAGTASLGLAFWVMVVELMQAFVVTRSPDITQPLLVILIGQGMDRLRVSPRTDPHGRQARPEANVADSVSVWKPRLITLVVSVLIVVIGVSVLLRTPGIPYNVRELFRNNGSIVDLTFFAFALLWTGAGSVWLAARLACPQLPELRLPAFTLLVSLVSLALLWASVTAESLDDIAGSSNVFWFVTNKSSWGDVWRDVFLYLDSPGVIGFLERCVRYWALYAPLPIFLACMVAVGAWSSARAGRSYAWLLRLSVTAVLGLWLCKAVAFDWSSTDNLNELLARDGEWGWGGGGYLYGLLLLMCANSLLLARAPAFSGTERSISVLLTVLALPVGWWLLNRGLEQQVEKYGSVFSGAQFLLGPDRRQLLSTEILFMRWCLVQTAGTVILAVGVWLGSGFLVNRRDGVTRDGEVASV